MQLECVERATRALALVVCLSLAVGCMGQLAPAPPRPPTLGEHPVGVTTIEVDDPGRARHLTVEVWYPAARASTAPPSVYEVEALGMTVARLASAAGAHRDVAPDRAEGPLPVVLFSHGRGSTRFANVGLSEVLASHGYLVAAPDHPGHTIDDDLAGIDDEARAESAFDRPLDLSRVLDDLVSRSEHDDPRFGGLVDAGRVAVAGHSFGGLAALGMSGARFDTVRQERECKEGVDDWRCLAAGVFGEAPYRYRDPRVKATLLIAPAGFDLYRDDGVARVDSPTLVVGGRLDQNTSYAAFSRPTFDALTSPRFLLDLPEAGHLTATDLCELIGSMGPLAKAFGGKDASDGCLRADFTSRDALDAVAHAALPFFDLYLNGHEDARGPLEAALAPAAPTGRIARGEPATVVR